jgi:DNA-directed RNA polymerase specialized sigma24 family protein
MPAFAYPVAIEGLLSRFVRRDPTAEREFHDLARPFLMMLARRYGRFLPPDQHEDVVHQALTLLLGGSGRKYNAARGSARTFLRLVVRRAVREVSAACANPGSRTRPPKRVAIQSERPLTAAPASTESPPDETDVVAVDDPARDFEIRHDVEAVLATAPPDVAEALNRIYIQDIPATRVAAAMNISRYAVGRKIDKFVETFST